MPNIRRNAAIHNEFLEWEENCRKEELRSITARQDGLAEFAEELLEKVKSFEAAGTQKLTTAFFLIFFKYSVLV